MGDMVGRKWGLIMSCLVFCLGVGLQLDTKWATFIVGRVIAGFGVVCNPFGLFFAFPILFGRVSCHASFPCTNQRYGVLYPGFHVRADDSQLRSVHPSQSVDLLSDFTNWPVSFMHPSASRAMY